MHFLILGSTGKSGGYAYKYALEQGHYVTALVRSSSSIPSHNHLTIVEGLVLSSADIDRAITAKGMPIDAVEFVGLAYLLPNAVANVVRALHEQTQRITLPSGRKPRLIVMSGAGIGESIGLIPFFLRFLIKHSNLGETYENHNGVNDEIEQVYGKDIVWTLPMPVMLSDVGIKPVKTFAPMQSGRGIFITRESCARWMVDVAQRKMENKFNN